MRDFQKRLSLTFAITAVVLCVEVIGGFLSNSLALLSDAGHVFTDAFAIGISLIAARISKRPSDRRATFGYQRAGILAAAINGGSLILIAFVIFTESYKRFLNPPGISLELMLPVAAFGLAANLLMAFILGGGHKDLNIKSAWLHVLGDTLSSIGVIVSGGVIYLTGWLYADPVAGFLIGLIILSGGLRVVWEALSVFLEFSPKGYDVEDIARSISDMPEVMGVHDMHIWSISRGKVAFTAHIWVHDRRLSEAKAVREKIADKLREKGIDHITLQLESSECSTDALFCQIHGDEE